MRWFSMIFKSFLCILGLFLSNTGRATQTLTVHGQSLDFQTVNTVDDHIVSGVLAEEALITFAFGNELRLSANTRVSFHIEEDSVDDLIIYDVFISDRLSKQTWVFSDTKSYEINCSKHSRSANYITFRKNKTLLSGCVLANDQTFSKNNPYHLEVPKDSRFSLDEDGEFLYAQYASGHLTVNGQEVELAEDTGVRLFKDKTIRYFTPSVNSNFKASTELSEETLIGQNSSSEFLMPVVFHENGQIENGWYVGPETQFNFKAFGGYQEIVLKDSPLKFSKDGRVSTFALTEPLSVYIYRDTLLTRTEININLTQTLSLNKGTLFELPAGAQISLERGELKNYTHQDPNGLQFVYMESQPNSSEQLSGLFYQTD